MIDGINRRLDNAKSNYKNGHLDKDKYDELRMKYSKKLKDKINDMHCKAANYLLSNYKTINIGNVSTKKMVSNLTGNLYSITKRRLMAISHYKSGQAIAPQLTINDLSIESQSQTITGTKNNFCKKIRRKFYFMFLSKYLVIYNLQSTRQIAEDKLYSLLQHKAKFDAKPAYQPIVQLAITATHP